MASSDETLQLLQEREEEEEPEVEEEEVLSPDSQFGYYTGYYDSHNEDEMEPSRGFLANNCRTGRRGLCIAVTVLAILIACTLFAYTAFASPSYTTSTLQQVAIVFRHGDRTPTETYPKDPYKTYEWPDGWGALTKKGMLQMYTLGKWLNKKYEPFIGKRYRSTVTRVSSSYAERCIMSGQALLAALYPPGPEDMFVPDLAWRPIPVHSTPRSLDKLIVVKSPCPRLEQELEVAYRNESARSDVSLASLYYNLSDKTGQKIETITDVEFLYNTLEIEEINGLKLPQWTKQYYNEEMRELAARSLALFTSNTVQQRLRGGPMLKEILQHMEDKRSGKDSHKMYLYAAHDLTIVNMLRAMGLTEFLKPDLGAALIFEMYLANGGQDHEIKVTYLNNTEMTSPHPIRIPGCADPCLLEDVMSTLIPVIPQNWDLECLIV